MYPVDAATADAFAHTGVIDPRFQFDQHDDDNDHRSDDHHHDDDNDHDDNNDYDDRRHQLIGQHIVDIQQHVDHDDEHHCSGVSAQGDRRGQRAHRERSSAVH